MSYNADDTICAIATAPGGAARGMVRVSGHDAIEIVEHVFQPNDGGVLRTSTNARAVSGAIRVVIDGHGSDANPPPAPPYKGGEIETNPSPALSNMGGKFELPSDLFLWPTSRSYTREPVAELHTFGSPPLLQAIIEALCHAGSRLAEPGEFTLRAFLAGRIDLTQAEAVLGVIDSCGATELKTALTQLAGGLALPLLELREGLLQLLAELEAGLDFVEEDIEFVTRQEVRSRIEAGLTLVENIVAQISSRHVARGLRQVTLVGAPNTGKSSLFNALVAQYGDADDAKRARNSPALVSPQRGTTRDYLTATVSLDGVLIELVDTAGVSDVIDKGDVISEFETAAESQAAKQRARAAIRACCVEVPGSAAELESTLGRLDDARDCEVLVVTKADLAPSVIVEVASSPRTPITVTSSRTGLGLAEFCSVCRMLLDGETGRPGAVVASTADRCRESLRLAASSLQSALNSIDVGQGNELVAVELRATLSELGKVTGAVYTDDLLDRIFKTFCIGK